MATSSSSLPPTSGGLLHVPEYYGLKVEDVVYVGHEDERASDTLQEVNASEPPATGAGSILVAKICDALERQGYENDVVRKVGELVARNMMTCDSLQMGGVDADADSETSIGKDGTTEANMLKSLLDKNTTRSRTVNMNSNEPVLLINVFDQTEKSKFYSTVDEIVQHLQQDWNIWPVRIYAGKYFPAPSGSISITLLNVVNTDIGGPSMVQLLDEHTEYSAWHNFARQEVWRGRDLVSREEGTWKSENEAGAVPDDRSEHSFQSDGADSTASELHLVRSSSPIRSEIPFEEMARGDPEEMSFSPSEPGQDQIEKPINDAEAEGSFVADEDAKSSPSFEQQGIPEHNIPEHDISYPTWDRRHDSTSLIDLIRSQALEIPPLGQDNEQRVESLEVAAAEPLSPDPEQKDEDAFVVL